VEKTYQFKGARILGAGSLLSREGLMPVGHSNSDLDALKPLKLSPINRARELLNSVIDDRHGKKAKEGVAACEKKNTALRPAQRRLLQTFIKALNAERTEPAHAQSGFFHELLTIGFCIFDLMQACFRDFHYGVFASPLFEA
jgi:hypothetical protein